MNTNLNILILLNNFVLLIITVFIYEVLNNILDLITNLYADRSFSEKITYKAQINCI